MNALSKMSSDDRAEAAELLLCSVENEADADAPNVIAAAWANEIERRADDNEPGVPAAVSSLTLEHD